MAELNIPTETEKIQNFVLVRYKRTAKASSFPLTLKRGRVEESRPRLQQVCFKMVYGLLKKMVEICSGFFNHTVGYFF